MGDALKQFGVGDATVGSHMLVDTRVVGQRELVEVLVLFLIEQVPAQELVQLVHVEEMALVLHWPRVGRLEDQLGHESDLLLALFKLLILGLESGQVLSRCRLIELTGTGRIRQLLLLDFGQLDLLQSLLLGVI